MVAVNRGRVSSVAAPFGGVKQSGCGRAGGFDALADYLEARYLRSAGDVASTSLDPRGTRRETLARRRPGMVAP